MRLEIAPRRRLAASRNARPVPTTRIEAKATRGQRIGAAQEERRRGQHRRRGGGRGDDREAAAADEPVAHQAGEQRDHAGLRRQAGNPRVGHRLRQQQSCDRQAGEQVGNGCRCFHCRRIVPQSRHGTAGGWLQLVGACARLSAAQRQGASDGQSIGRLGELLRHRRLLGRRTDGTDLRGHRAGGRCQPRRVSSGLRAFVTPIIVHFGMVLALAAFLSMPHPSILALSLGFAAIAATSASSGVSSSSGTCPSPAATTCRSPRTGSGT